MKPAIGQRTGKNDKTHWIIFTKETGDDTCNLKSALLDSAYRRLHELESLLLPEVPETVWPAEVKMIFEQINNAESLPEHHQRRLKHHINRMWLEKMSVQAIVIAARSLMNAMEKYA